MAGEGRALWAEGARGVRPIVWRQRLRAAGGVGAVGGDRSRLPASLAHTHSGFLLFVFRSARSRGLCCRTAGIEPPVIIKPWIHEALLQMLVKYSLQFQRIVNSLQRGVGQNLATLTRQGSNRRATAPLLSHCSQKRDVLNYKKKNI